MKRTKYKEVKSANVQDYAKYRGKCKEMSEALIKENPSLRLVRGYYWDLIWGKQPHWWCEDKEGNIVDPTKDQFPTKGEGTYEEFNGVVRCANCGKEMKEKDVPSFHGNYAFCSIRCEGYFIGVF